MGSPLLRELTQAARTGRANSPENLGINLGGAGRGWSGGGGVGGGPANAEAYMRKYGAVSTLFAIVDRLVTSTARPTWHLMRKGTETEVMSHPCIDLWNQPNDFYTQNDFIEAVQQHMDLVGEMWWVVARSKLGFGPPLELWPIRPDKMTPIPDPETFISGYIYSNGGEKVPLALEDVIWTKKQNPLDPYRGIGPVQTIMTDLDADNYSAAWNANFFRNSALPGGIITLENHLDDAQFDEFLLRWREQHQGVANSHRVAVIEKATFQEMKYTQRDMQFTQLRQMTTEIIALAFGFPLHMLGIAKDINRANAEAQEVLYAKWLIVPRLERIKQLLNTKLLPMYPGGDQLEWVYEDPTPEDRLGDAEVLKAAAEAAKILIDTGFDPIEVLEAAHLPTLKYEKPEPPPQLMAPGQPPVPGEGDEEEEPVAPKGKKAPKKKGEEDEEEEEEPVKDQDYRRLLNKVRDDSKKEMTSGWEGRLGRQQSALLEFLEARWT